MRIFVELDDGHLEPFGELSDVHEASQLLIFKVNRYMRTEDARILENDLSKKCKKTCIVLGPEFESVFGTR